MNSRILSTAIVAIAGMSLVMPAVAENLSHTNQLLATKQCVECDLSGVGLVMSNLSGAKLKGANLSNANLSQANLSGADLSGADLSGASLHGANLTNANLSNAKLNGADLRDAYLIQTKLENVDLDRAYIQGTTGITKYNGTPKQFHRWAAEETKKGNYSRAIVYYDRAIGIDSKYAPAYLGRGLAFYRLGNERGATSDAKAAAKLFQKQKNNSGYTASQKFLQAIQWSKQPKEAGVSNIERWIGSVGSLLLQFLL